MSIEDMFTLNLPPVENPVPLSGQPQKPGRPRLSAAERLQRKKDREESSAKPVVQNEPPKLDLRDATKSIGGLIVAMSKTKRKLNPDEINAMSATAEKSLALALNVENEETSKWIVHGQTLLVWAGTMLPRFFPGLFEENKVQATITEIPTEERKD